MKSKTLPKRTASLGALAMITAMGISGQVLADSDTPRDAAVHSQFGYPNADSGPHGAAAIHHSTARSVQPAANTTTAESAAVRAQFGYPGADSGPYGATASTDAVGSANYKLPFEQSTLSGRTGGSPTSGQVEEDAAIKAQFGYPNGDSGPYGGW